MAQKFQRGRLSVQTKSIWMTTSIERVRGIFLRSFGVHNKSKSRNPDSFNDVLQGNVFKVWGYVKGPVYVKGLVCVLLLTSLEKNMQRIIATLETVTQNILRRIWQKLDYRRVPCNRRCAY